MRTRWICLFLLLSNLSQAQLSEQSFNRPEAVYAPRVCWQWLNGNVTREGINLDLEAMAATGLGGGILFYNAVGTAAGTELTVHALQQADRLGLKLLLHGTSSPWISPENATQQVVWSEANVKGGETVNLQLPKPYTNQGFYKDIAVLAYPSLKGEEQPFRSLLQSVTINGKPVDANVLTDFDFHQSITLDRVPAEMVLSFNEPLEAACFIVHREKTPTKQPFGGFRDDSPTLQLESSDDGILYAKVCELTTPALRTSEVPAFVNFPSVKAKYYRIRSNKPTSLTEIELVAAPRMEGWDWKSNFRCKAGSFHFNPDEPAQSSIVNTSKIIDLTSWTNTDGSLSWNAPKGNWTIVRLGCTVTGTDLEMDKFSRYGVQQYYDKFLKPLFEQTRPYHSHCLEGLVLDSVEAGDQNWTRDMLSEFHKRAGYDLKTYLLAFTGRYVNSAIETERFLWDLHRVQSDLLVEGYYGGMRNILQNEKLSLLIGDFELPEKASLADYPSELKINLDLKFVQRDPLAGYIDFAHQPHPTAQPGTIMGPFGTQLNRNNTWFNKATDYFEYLRRCQYVLQSGLFVADAAYFMGEEVVGPIDLQNPNTGHAFDVLSRDMLQHIIVQNHCLVLPNGMSYRFLILPDIKTMSLPVLRKLKVLLEDGLWISAVKPTTWPGLLSTKDQTEWQSIVEELWSILPDGVFRYGSGRLFINLPASRLFEEAKLGPDFTYTCSNPNAVVNYLHRRISSDDVWFVCNNRRENDTILASFRIIGMQPEWWNPQTGECRSIHVFRQHDEQTLIPLTLQPSESGFVVFRKPLKQPVYDGLMNDGVPLLSANPDDYSMATPADLKENFSLSVWAKPDVVAKKDRSFLLFPQNGSEKYGTGNATIGLTIGQNGVRVFEQETQVREVLDIPQKLEGWNLITIIYKNNIPIVCINGIKVGEGKKSPFVVHANRNELAPVNPLIQLFQGENTKPEWNAQALDSATVQALFAKGRPMDGLPETLNLNGNLLFRKKGGYSLLNPGTYPEKPTLLIKRDLPVYDFSRDWMVHFPEGKGAPEQLSLDTLISLHQANEFGAKYFSGTASWQHSFKLTPKDLFGNHLILDLGQVAVMAEIYVNGKSAGMCWKPPFRLEITNLLRPGDNQLDIRVTNLLVNRLIGDEFLPVENQYDDWGEIKALPEWYLNNLPKIGQRVTFATWKCYDQNSPLVESGLVGPVTLSLWKSFKE
jgi:hypothetical protein